MRRPVAGIVAIILFVEAIGIAMLNWILGAVVDGQNMSLAGLDPDAMSVSSKAAGLVFGLYFALCGLAALLVALRDRPAAGLWRILLISAAVVHGVLGAFTVGLVGWGAFAFMMVVLGLIVLTLMTYDRREGPADTPSTDDTEPEPEDGGGKERESKGETPDNGGPAPLPSTP